MGGDEFTLLLENTDEAAAAATAQRIIESLRQPIMVSDFEIYSGVSIGIAMHPAHGSDISTLLQNADSAMYHAKEQGKNTYSFFNDDLQIKAAIQLQVESGLPRAIAENELVLHYQPQVELDSGRVVGLEALVRWQHPHDGMLFPGKFIPQAEKKPPYRQAGRMGGRHIRSPDRAVAQRGTYSAQGFHQYLALAVFARRGPAHDRADHCQIFHTAAPAGH